MALVVLFSFVTIITLFLEWKVSDAQIMYKMPSYYYFSSANCRWNRLKFKSDDCRTGFQCFDNEKAYIRRCHYSHLDKDHGCYTYQTPSCLQNDKARVNKCKKTKKKFIADSKFCHQYYECQNPKLSKECVYPKLFSEETNSCEHYSKVKCGSRMEFKSPCQYSKNLCHGRCIPCDIYIQPNCETYPDGIFPWKGRGKGSPFYMQCKDDRLVKAGMCKRGLIRTNEIIKACNKILNIPCGKGESRLYPSMECTSYIWCYYGNKYEFRCPRGTVFDERRRRCAHTYNTCKPCGTKSC